MRSALPSIAKDMVDVSVKLAYLSGLGALMMAFADRDPAAMSMPYLVGYGLGYVIPAILLALMVGLLLLWNTDAAIVEMARLGKYGAGVLSLSVAGNAFDHWEPQATLGVMVAVWIAAAVRANQLHRAVAKRAVTPVTQPKNAPSGQEERSKTDFLVQPDLPTRTLDDLAGMDELKAQLLEAGREAMRVVKPGRERDEVEPPRNGILLEGDPGNGKTLMAEALAGSLRLPIMKMTFGNVGSQYVFNSTANIVRLFEEARSIAPMVLFMDEVDSALKCRDNPNNEQISEQTNITNEILTQLVTLRGTGVVAIMATNYVDRLDKAAIRMGRVDFRIHVPHPDGPSRHAIITMMLRRLNKGVKVGEGAVAQAVKRWEGFSAARIAGVVDAMVREANQAKPRSLVYADFQAALRKSQGALGVRLDEATPVLADLHMPEAQKEALQGIAKRMLSIEDIERMGGSVPTGVLLAGPPGTGKTLAVRALAKTTGWPLFMKNGADLIRDDKAVDKLLSDAKDARPCIVFLDEADDILGDRRANTQYVASVTNKLLIAMDGGPGRPKDIVWMAATNAPDALESAALRGGRFTEKIWFDNPDVRTVAAIVKQWMERNPAKFAPDLTPEAIAQQLAGMSPANIHAILGQAVNVMIGRASVRNEAATVSPRDLEKAISIVLL